MTTHGSFFKRSASSLAKIRTSVMAGLSCFWVAVWVEPKILLASRLREHLAELLGGGRDDRDEIGLAQPALDAVTPEVAARAAMKHRRMRGSDAGVAEPQAQRQDAAPIAVLRIEGIARQRHGLGFEIGEQIPELHRLLRQI